MKITELILNEVYIDPKTKEVHLDLERLDSHDLKQLITVWAAIEAKKEYDADLRKNQFHDEDDPYVPEPVFERAEHIITEFSQYLYENRYDDNFLKSVVDQLESTKK
jgi:hypothetical protein